MNWSDIWVLYRRELRSGVPRSDYRDEWYPSARVHVSDHDVGDDDRAHVRSGPDGPGEFTTRDSRSASPSTLRS